MMIFFLMQYIFCTSKQLQYNPSFMCSTAHGEQCCMAEVPPNRTNCNVTGNILQINSLSSCHKVSNEA